MNEPISIGIVLALFVIMLVVTRSAARSGRAPAPHCFEAGCSKPATHRIRITVRAEHGERVDIMARIIVPAVLCREHALAEEPLAARDVMPRNDRRVITKDLERMYRGVPVSWDRSVVEIRHRFVAWLLWRAS